MLLVLHLILVVKQQTRVLGGRCCHPIFNSPLCVKITISFQWTISALLSMVAQVFLWNQFIISLLVLREGCSHRCRLGSCWCLSHIPFTVLVAVGKRMNEWMRESLIPFPFLISLCIWQAVSKLQLFRLLQEGEFSPTFASPLKYSNGTQPGFVSMFLMPFGFEPNCSL